MFIKVWLIDTLRVSQSNITCFAKYPDALSTSRTNFFFYIASSSMQNKYLGTLVLLALKEHFFIPCPWHHELRFHWKNSWLNMNTTVRLSLVAARIVNSD